MKQSSLFLFHRNSKIRRSCLQLVEPPEILQELANLEKNGNLDNYVHSKNKQRTQSFFKATTKKDKTRHPSKVFEDIVLILITLSAVLLAVDNPLNDPKSQSVKIIGYIDIGFTCLFFIEAMIKIIAKGLIFNTLGPIEPYLRSYWNMLDAFVVLASIVDFIFTVNGLDSQSLQALKALRALRALRPLRMISRNEGMRLVVNALLASLPSMTNVLLVCSIFLLIFSIAGVNFFKGTFYKCVDKPYLQMTKDIKEIITKQDCLDANGIWENSASNFDNSIKAMSTLFQMTTTEGWVDVMHDGIDSVGIDMQPKRNNNIYLVSFFVAFMITGSQFIINLFVGVVIDNFNTIKEKEELGNTFVTDQQRSWIEIQKVGQGKQLRIKINEPKGCRKHFFRLVSHRYFEYTITFFILMNTIVMSMKRYRMGQDMEDFSEYANFVFTFVFNVEMFFKLIGLGRIYFNFAWNIFDMFIVISSDLGILLQISNIQAQFSSTVTIFRAFRIMRLFKLIRASVHIRLILDTVFNILPQISNVMSLIMLLFFIFAALGINLFSGVMLQERLDRKNNFQSFGNAMVILMKFSTGEDWNAYMHELANKDGFNNEKCIEIQTYQDIQDTGKFKQCGTTVSYLYFISFTIIVTMLIMNLSVAAVIEGLDTAKKENMGIVQGDEIEALIDHW